jgi:hypothetical protein
MEKDISNINILVIAVSSAKKPYVQRPNTQRVNAKFKPIHLKRRYKRQIKT